MAWDPDEETGWDPRDLAPHLRQEMAEAHKRHMIYGALWFVGGSAVTLITMASGQGVILAWGAIIWGLIDFVRGLNGWIKYR